MTEYIILAVCVIIILSYIFDISSKYSRVPGVLFLILLGIAIQLITKSAGFIIPNFRPVLPVFGTLGLILIVMEASLDIHLQKEKKMMIIKSITSAIVLSALFMAAFSWIQVKFLDYALRPAVINSIPLSIISSSVAIPSSAHFAKADKEFIVYESSFSDIFGIMIFDLFMQSNGSVFASIMNFTLDGLITVVIALVATAALAILLHRTTYHVNYIIIVTAIVMIYVVAKMFHFPALLVILIFGLILANNQLIDLPPVRKFVDFGKFRKDIDAFKKLSGELTFIVRSFFFIIFGFYTKIEGLFDLSNLVTGFSITAGIFLLRWLFFSQTLKLPAIPLVFYSPRGLITILLFLSIPAELRVPLITEEVVTIVIFMTMIFVITGNMLNKNTTG